ncbi:MAG: NAD-binding protein [Thermoleophilia bacterium]
MNARRSTAELGTPRVLLIGNDELTAVTQRALQDAGARVTNLRDSSDPAIRTALGHGIDTAVVISKDDHVSLRNALVVESICPGIPLVVTVFDRDVAVELGRGVRNARVMSMADIVVPSLAGPCLDERLLSLHRSSGVLHAVGDGDDGPRIAPIDAPARTRRARLMADVGAMLRPHELSAKILLGGIIGFVLVLAIDAIATMIVLHEPPVEAFYAATKVIITVGPNHLVDEGPTWFKGFSATMMIVALAFTALFTAGLVNRLVDPRLCAIFGRRCLPRSDHVVVVGLGQVGLRLCLLLRELDMPVVAIESNPEADYVARAKDYGIPVVIGSGASGFVLRRVSVRRARALAAVTSDEVENIAVVAAAHGEREHLRTVLRAGRGDVRNETRALLKLGVVRDVYHVGGTLLAAAALGSDACEALLHEQTVYLVAPDGRIEPFQAPGTRRLTAPAPPAAGSVVDETRPEPGPGPGPGRPRPAAGS